MVRSLYSGVSGMKNHQIRMDVIADNIANVNTIGFKGSRVVFKDFFSQTLRYPTDPQGAAGTTTGMAGMNAMQVGLGVNIATIDIRFGGATGGTRTEQALDFMIEGDGFFVVRNHLGQEFYTRAGNFYQDAVGNLVTADGMYVMWARYENGDSVSQAERDDETSPVFNMYPNDDGISAANFKWRSEDSDYEGNWDEITIDAAGIVKGRKGQDEFILGQIITATFQNPNALVKAGGNLYRNNGNAGPTGDPANPGDMYYHMPGSGKSGKLLQGMTEMSNVDLAQEFSDMIVTQRGYQANSRIITVSDSMVEELVNLKR